jgi:hypothetical protein
LLVTAVLLAVTLSSTVDAQVSPDWSIDSDAEHDRLLAATWAYLSPLSDSKVIENGFDLPDPVSFNDRFHFWIPFREVMRCHEVLRVSTGSRSSRS